MEPKKGTEETLTWVTPYETLTPGEVAIEIVPNYQLLQSKMVLK